jgi:predicted DNA-binding transcriptional regulator AlpA
MVYPRVGRRDERSRQRGLNYVGKYGNSRTIVPVLGIAHSPADSKDDDMATANPVQRGNLTVVDVCAELGIARSTFYDWRAARKAPHCFRLPNGGLRIRRSEFDRWLESLQESA